MKTPPLPECQNIVWKGFSLIQPVGYIVEMLRVVAQRSMMLTKSPAGRLILFFLDRLSLPNKVRAEWSRQDQFAQKAGSRFSCTL
jgi:hypothetical protein